MTKAKDESLVNRFFVSFPRRPMYAFDLLVLNKLREQDKLREQAKNKQHGS